MNQTLLTQFGNSFERVANALDALRKGKGVLVTDDERRENEGDLIFPAQSISETQMAARVQGHNLLDPSVADHLEYFVVAHLRV
jgi:3,4-dihydroxy 2-butanone 4-phosphate synthase